MLMKIYVEDALLSDLTEKFPKLGLRKRRFEECYQAIPGNDQNASPTNQKTAGNKLDRTDVLWLLEASGVLFQVVFWCKYVCWDVFSDTW